jgi:hypothetical protein
MWKILIAIAYACFVAWGLSAIFGGSSYPVQRCKEFTWQAGDAAKGFGKNVVSPCVVNDLP